MHMHNLNWLAILVAAISAMVVDFCGTRRFFSRSRGCARWATTERQSQGTGNAEECGPAYGGSFVASLVSAFTLALILHGVRGEDSISNHS